MSVSTADSSVGPIGVMSSGRNQRLSISSRGWAAARRAILVGDGYGPIDVMSSDWPVYAWGCMTMFGARSTHSSWHERRYINGEMWLVGLVKSGLTVIVFMVGS